MHNVLTCEFGIVKIHAPLLLTFNDSKHFCKISNKNRNKQQRDTVWLNGLHKPKACMYLS